MATHLLTSTGFISSPNASTLVTVPGATTVLKRSESFQICDGAGNPLSRIAPISSGSTVTLKCAPSLTGGAPSRYLVADWATGVVSANATNPILARFRIIAVQRGLLSTGSVTPPASFVLAHPLAPTQFVSAGPGPGLGVVSGGAPLAPVPAAAIMSSIDAPTIANVTASTPLVVGFGSASPLAFNITLTPAAGSASALSHTVNLLLTPPTPGFALSTTAVTSNGAATVTLHAPPSITAPVGIDIAAWVDSAWDGGSRTFHFSINPSLDMIGMAPTSISSATASSIAPFILAAASLPAGTFSLSISTDPGSITLIAPSSGGGLILAGSVPFTPGTNSAPVTFTAIGAGAGRSKVIITLTGNNALLPVSKSFSVNIA